MSAPKNAFRYPLSGHLEQAVLRGATAVRKALPYEDFSGERLPHALMLFGRGVLSYLEGGDSDEVLAQGLAELVEFLPEEEKLWTPSQTRKRFAPSARRWCAR